jgi:glycosyltransferase involved in cell wall biosynthesis
MGDPCPSGETGGAPLRPIKVLYVCTALNRGSGGERHPLALAQHLDRSRFEFAVCVIETASESARSKLTGAGRALYELDLSRRLYNPYGWFRIVQRLYRLLAALRPDVVQTHALHANLLARPAARWAGVRVIVSTENVLPDVERQPWRRALNAPLHGLNKLLDRRTERIVVVSEAVRRWKDPGGRSQKIRVIPPPFDLEVFGGTRTEPARSGPARRGSGPALGVVGRLTQEKGHRFLIAAMPEILAQQPDARLLIVGSGPLERALRAEVEALALAERVEFLGYLEDVGAAVRQMDILIVPSLSDAFPLVVLEGMMMELPVVGTRVGGIGEIVLDGETGLLVSPGDSRAIAAACRYLLSHPDAARDMGRRGRQRALAEFHPARFIDRHERLYSCAVDGAAGRHPRIAI